MRMLTLFAVMVLVCAVAPADDKPPSASGTESSWDTPPNLDLILKGVDIGTRLTAFLPLHPRARYSAPDKKDAPPRATDDDADLEERFDTDPLLRLWCTANYGFKKGRLREFIVVWGCDREAFAARHRRFLQACVRKRGKRFRREAKKINGETQGLPYAPVLVWSDRQTVFVASCAVERNAKKQMVGSFTYGAFPKDDPLVQSMFAAKALTQPQLEQLYRGVDEALGGTKTAPKE